jgi:tetratricopeptide (TPR) repeat protein
MIDIEFTLRNAQEYEKKGDLGTAIRICNEGLSRRPDNVRLLWRIAKLSEKTGDWQSAEAAYDKLSQMPPVSYVVYFNAARIKHSLQKFDEALRLFRSFLSAVPEDRKNLRIKEAAKFFMEDCVARMSGKVQEYPQQNTSQGNKPIQHENSQQTNQLQGNSYDMSSQYPPLHKEASKESEIRYHSCGQASVHFRCPPQYTETVLQAIANTINNHVMIDHVRFTEFLQNSGLSENMINEIKETMMMMDDTSLEEEKYTQSGIAGWF